MFLVVMKDRKKVEAQRRGIRKEENGRKTERKRSKRGTDGGWGRGAQAVQS